MQRDTRKQRDPKEAMYEQRTHRNLVFPLGVEKMKGSFMLMCSDRLQALLRKSIK